MNHQIQLADFPPRPEVENKKVLKKVAEAHRYLGELNGVIQGVPNQAVLLNLLPLQEAKYSSEIENIVTTHDEIFQSQVLNEMPANVKEVANYAKALVDGFDFVKDKKFLVNRTICKIQAQIIKNQNGFRVQQGTALKNNRAQVIYTPPQHKDEIAKRMKGLEDFINTDQDDFDPLLKMALIHHQFESIHPFYDGNGRVGRIINVLYLCLKGLLDLPILYLSRYIIQYKSDYYRLLQEVREKNQWEEWIIWMLDGVIFSSLEMSLLVNKIKNQMQQYKKKIREDQPKMYSQDLINTLFKHPYTKIEYLERDLDISRQTAAKYLDTLDKMKLLTKVKKGRTNYYINQNFITKALEHRDFLERIHNPLK